MMRRTFLMAVVMTFVATGAFSDQPKKGPYIMVDIRGTLETGIVAIGGETTGTVIHVKKVTWELDLGGNKELQELAKQLHMKEVIVTGEYQQVPGVEIRVRHIVKVKTLKAA
jgi:hypothetical protein